VQSNISTISPVYGIQGRTDRESEAPAVRRSRPLLFAEPFVGSAGASPSHQDSGISILEIRPTKTPAELNGENKEIKYE